MDKTLQDIFDELDNNIEFKRYRERAMWHIKKVDEMDKEMLNILTELEGLHQTISMLESSFLQERLLNRVWDMVERLRSILKIK